MNHPDEAAIVLLVDKMGSSTHDAATTPIWLVAVGCELSSGVDFLELNLIC
jgi:hypothetical protein